MAVTDVLRKTKKGSALALPDTASVMAEIDRKIADLVTDVNQTRAASVEADRVARISAGRLEEAEIAHLVGHASADDAVRAREEARTCREAAMRLRQELTDRLAALERVERLRPQLLRGAQQRIVPELKRAYREALEAIEKPARLYQAAVAEAMRIREHILNQEIHHFHPSPVNVFGLPVPFSEFLAGPNTGTNRDRIDEFVRDLEASGL